MTAPVKDESAGEPGARRPPWWRRPTDIAALGYALGAAAAASSMGFIALRAEARGGVPESADAAGSLAGTLLLAIAFEALLWGALVRAAASRDRALQYAILGIPAIIAGILVFFGFVVGGHTRPSLFPTTGFVAGCVLDVALIASYAPVLRLAAQASVAPTEVRPRDVLAAGCAWAAAVATIGLILAPGVIFGLPCAVVIVVAAFGLHLALASAVEAGDAGARRSKLTLLPKSLRAGAARVAIGGLVLVPVRLHEQAVTRHPAVLAIYRANGGHQCDVRPAGSEGGISFWSVDCGSSKGPTFGWDERAHALLAGEALYERVPRLRPLPSSTAR